jgi:hypothetical protein
LVRSATLAGAYDLVETVLWAEQHLSFPRRFYPYDRGIPSHDTLCDVFAALDPELFKSCFLAWVEDLRDGDPEIIAIDGKTLRRSHDRGKGRNPLHLGLGGTATDRPRTADDRGKVQRDHRHSAAAEASRPEGTPVTIDAMGTQTSIARAIRDGGGDYCLSLKENWPAVHAEVDQLFNDPENAAMFETNEIADKTGGRIETCRHTGVPQGSIG